MNSCTRCSLDQVDTPAMVLRTPMARSCLVAFTYILPKRLFIYLIKESILKLIYILYLNSVDDRHLQVHENEVKVSARAMDINSFLAIDGHIKILYAKILQEPAVNGSNGGVIIHY